MKKNTGEKSELKDLKVFEVSIVDAAANGKTFLAIKSDEPRHTIISGLQKAIDGDAESFEYFLKEFVEKATPEQIGELGFVVKEENSEDKSENASEDKPEETVEAKVEKDAGTSGENDITKLLQGLTKKLDGMDEKVNSVINRLEKTETSLNKMKNVTKSTGDVETTEPEVVNKSTYREDRKSEILSDEIGLDIRKMRRNR